MAAPGPRIITFYSYKGGTGRSMALANLAWVLASNGRKVLAVDWDLEAPGLHRYFHPFLLDPELTSSTGVIDLMEGFVNAAVGADDAEEGDNWYEPLADVQKHAVALRWAFPGTGRLDFLPAGRQGPAYAERVNAFDWRHFYETLGGGVFLDAVRASMRQHYDYVLIDSRTGVSDTSGICTIQMADLLVVCFTANRQSVEGAAAVAGSVRDAWAGLDSEMPRRIFPVLTRVEVGEHERLLRAREHVRAAFDCFLDHLDRAGRDSYWDRVEIQYYPFYAYEEILAVFGDKPGVTKSVLASAENLSSYLTDGAVTAVNPPSDTERERVLALACRGRLGADREQPAPRPVRTDCRIFVSSTVLDLRDHRARAIQALRDEGFHVDAREEWGVTPTELAKTVRERLRGGDLFLLLVAFRRGHIRDDQGLSVTQLEYQAAQELGLGILVFMLREDEPWPRRWDEMDRDPGVRVWRDKLRRSHPVIEFGLSPATLQIVPAVLDWLAQRQAWQARPQAAQASALLKDRDPRSQEGHWTSKVAAADLVASYNRLAGVLDSIAQVLPSLWANLTAQAEGKPSTGPDQAGEPLLRRFKALGERIQKHRCRIGLFGPPQSGKSTTVNHLLGVPHAAGPTLAGAGAACTGNVTRVYAKPPDQQPVCTLVFLTPAEFEERRRALCRLLEFDPHQGLPELIREVRSRIEQGPRAERGSKGTAASCAAFLRFLTSAQTYAASHSEPRRIESVEYARRGEFLTPVQGNQPSAKLLLREVAIGFPTSAIPAEVDLLDFPGADYTRLTHGEVPESLLAGIDAALVFQRIDQLQSPEAEKWIAKLWPVLGPGRIRIVFTMLHTVPPEHREGNDGTLLDALVQVLDRHSIPHGDALLLSNLFYQRLQAAPDHKPNEELYRTILHLDVKGGQPVLPAGFARQPALCEVYRRFLEDGGIGDLRRGLARMVETIEEDRSAGAARELRPLANEVAELLELAKERAAMNIEDVAAVLAWEGKVRALVTRIDRDRAIVEVPGRALEAKLRARFQRLRPDSDHDYGYFPAEELLQRHRTIGRVLAAEAVSTARYETLPGMWEKVKKALRDAIEAADLQEVHLPSGLGPLAALDEACKKDQAHPGEYAAVLDSLRGEELFDGNFSFGPEYSQVIERKIAVVVAEAAHLMAQRIKEQLRDLSRQLGLLGSDTLADSLRGDEIDGLLQALREI
jgi:cellulose biosynthesis protein BcsQ